MLFDVLDMPDAPPCDHLYFGIARQPWQVRSYHALRRAIFCDEQNVFDGDDRDAIDDAALPIVATTQCMGVGDDVVGVVRIDERQPRVWWGSRLGVAQPYRSQTAFTAHGVFPNRATVSRRFASVGAALIYKAVSTAHALGCDRFLAHVQHQNVRFFEWLHWRSLGEVTLHGLTHHRMEADLAHYPPSVFVAAPDRLPVARPASAASNQSASHAL